MFHKIKSSRSTSEQANIRPSRDKPLLSFLLSPPSHKNIEFHLKYFKSIKYGILSKNI